MIRPSEQPDPPESGALSRPRSGGGRVRLVAACLVLLAAGGCGDGGDEEPSETAPRVDAVRTAGAAVPGARYHTELTFVGSGQPPTLLHLRFDNLTDSLAVRMRYRGWFAGETWRPVLEHRDSLPVPRAAWRVLPTGPLRLVVGEGGEPASVILELEAGTLRLDSRGAIGSWNSSTGQRESLRLAELQEGPRGESGLLLSRQRARRVDDAVPPDIAQYFLLSDTLGNGVLLMRDSTAPDAPVTAWTWYDGQEAEWSDALVLTLASTGASPGRWSFELAEAGLLGELRGVEPAWNELPPEGTGFEMFRLEGRLLLDGQPWTLSGVGVQERGP